MIWLSRLPQELDVTPVRSELVPAANAAPVDATITVAFEQFRDELRIRLFCSATITGNNGPGTFWLSDWTA